MGIHVIAMNLSMQGDKKLITVKPAIGEVTAAGSRDVRAMVGSFLSSHPHQKDIKTTLPGLEMQIKFLFEAQEERPCRQIAKARSMFTILFALRRLAAIQMAEISSDSSMETGAIAQSTTS